MNVALSQDPVTHGPVVQFVHRYTNNQGKNKSTTYTVDLEKMTQHNGDSHKIRNIWANVVGDEAGPSFSWGAHLACRARSNTGTVLTPVLQIADSQPPPPPPPSGSQPSASSQPTGSQPSAGTGSQPTGSQHEPVTPSQRPSEQVSAQTEAAPAMEYQAVTVSEAREVLAMAPSQVSRFLGAKNPCPECTYGCRLCDARKNMLARLYNRDALERLVAAAGTSWDAFAAEEGSRGSHKRLLEACVDMAIPDSDEDELSYLRDPDAVPGSQPASYYNLRDDEAPWVNPVLADPPLPPPHDEEDLELPPPHDGSSLLQMDIDLEWKSPFPEDQPEPNADNPHRQEETQMASPNEAPSSSHHRHPAWGSYRPPSSVTPPDLTPLDQQTIDWTRNAAAWNAGGGWESVRPAADYR